MEIPKGFTPLQRFGHKVQQTVLPIVAMSKDKITPLGTGFLIAPWGLLVTARHVINTEAYEWLEDKENPTYLYALYVTDEKNENGEEFFGGPIKITSVSFNPEYDIAYCLLERFTIAGVLFDYPCVRLDLEPPRINENILGFGYHKSSASYAKNEPESKTTIINYEQNTSFTTGIVQKHYFPKRDSNFLNFPCFETSARFEPGMSGGPIFKERGSVGGVICSSFGGLSEDDGYISYASMIWPTLVVGVPITNVDGETKSTTIFDLIKEGHIPTESNMQKFAVSDAGNGLLTVSYRP